LGIFVADWGKRDMGPLILLYYLASIFLDWQRGEVYNCIGFSGLRAGKPEGGAYRDVILSSGANYVL